MVLDASALVSPGLTIAFIVRDVPSMAPLASIILSNMGTDAHCPTDATGAPYVQQQSVSSSGNFFLDTVWLPVPPSGGNVYIEAVTCFYNASVGTNPSNEPGFPSTLQPQWRICELTVSMASGMPDQCGAAGGCEIDDEVCIEGQCRTYANESSDACALIGTTCEVGLCNASADACYLEPIPCSQTTPPPPQCHEYAPCVPNSTGNCLYVPVSDGTPCVDMVDPCGQSPTCQSGQCVSTPVQCDIGNGPPCTIAATLNTATCTCTYVPTPTIGQSCGVGACTGQVTCNASTNTVYCSGAAPMHEVCGDGIDQDCNGADQPCGACATDGDCSVPAHGCVIGLCMPMTGTCTYVDAMAGMTCTPSDFCADGATGVCDGAGNCTGTSVSPPNCSVSTAALPCVAGHCSPRLNQCVNETATLQGVACGSFCNVGAQCNGAGACTGGTPRTCSGASECAVMACNDTSAQCELQSYAAVGTPCVGGSLSTCPTPHTCDGADQCIAANVTCPEGLVAPSPPVVMSPLSSSSSSSSPMPSMPSSMMMMMGGGGD